jgi:hypothetical protein
VVEFNCGKLDEKNGGKGIRKMRVRRRRCSERHWF